MAKAVAKSRKEGYKDAQTVNKKTRSQVARQTKARKAVTRDDDEDESPKSNSGSDASEDEYEVPASDEEAVEELDSDALDDDDDFDAPTVKGKRKRTSPSKSQTNKPKSDKGVSPRKKRRSKADANNDEELELAEGQEIVGRVIQAPKEGRVPPGRISKNTLDFLGQLRKPECNDREWCVHFRSMGTLRAVLT
jgi:hypothetical protein